MSRSPLLPEQTQERVDGEDVELRFVIPNDYIYMKGHFPGNPLVPGLTQIGWMMEGIRRLWDLENVIVSKFRFTRPIRAGQTVVVRITSSNGRFTCETRADGEIASKGFVRAKEGEDGL